VKKLSLIAIVALAGILLAVAGCNKSEEAAQQAAPASETAAAAEHPASAEHPAAAPAGDMWTGTVAETMNASNYTYILLDRGGDKVWVAGPQLQVAVGDKVSMAPGMAMHDFESKALNRTFDTVYFVGAIQKGDAPAAGGGMPAGGVEMGGSAGGAMGGDATSHMATERETITGIEKAAGGQTVAECFVDAASLKGKDVKVRGKVVKYTPNIMGKNWIHIQDGTGSAGMHDLTITTSATVKVGDTVLVEGPLSVDKDFGAGYRYPVIIEDAKVTVE